MTPPARSRRPRCSGAVLAHEIPAPGPLADALEVVGLFNVQFAVKDGKVFVIEANPAGESHGPVRE